jgi:hypothetical protein
MKNEELEVLNKIVSYLSSKSYFKIEELPSALENYNPDLIVKYGKAIFVIEVKIGPCDKFIPLFYYADLLEPVRYYEKRGFFVVPILVSNQKVSIDDFQLIEPLRLFLPLGILDLNKIGIDEVGMEIDNLRIRIESEIESNFEMLILHEKRDLENHLTSLQKIAQYAPFLDSEKQIQLVKKLITTSDFNIIEEMCYFIGRTKNPALVPYLLQFLHDKNPRLQERVVKSLLDLWDAVSEQVKDFAFTSYNVILTKESDIKELFHLIKKIIEV